MQKILLLSICLACGITLSAQKNKVRAKLTETTLVTDTAGNVIPFALWKNLIASSDISLNPQNPADENSPFIIRRLSAEEKVKLMETLPKPSESKSFKTGANFISFNETDIEGNRYKIKEMKGKVIVINFWFINCPPCQYEIPELNQLVENYKDNKDVVFIGIALDEKFELKEFLRRSPFNYNIIPSGMNLAQLYRINSFPTHVVVDKEGKVKFHTTGLAKNTVHWVKKSIDESLNAAGLATASLSTSQ